MAPAEVSLPGWHSWDPHPWKHPWLTTENLTRAKAFSQAFLERERKALERVDPRKLRIGFCGNIANCLYVRAVPLRRAGLDISIIMHPGDSYIMSQPAWEEFDGVLPDGVTTLEAARNAGLSFPDVDKVVSYPAVQEWRDLYSKRQYSFLRRTDMVEFPSYLGFMPTLVALQEMDVLWATQAPYFAYLARRPYVVSQMGGDLWFEASRGDELGALMRRSFASARVNIVSNPWVYSNARRYGMTNLVYLPKILDQSVYAPGVGSARREWEESSGGDFFVLTSSRLDDRNKGSSVGVEGFAAFSRDHPGARLVLFGWGNDRARLEKRLTDLGIMERTLMLPVAGKARLRDCLRSADVFMDQFILGYFGSAGLEAMATGLPMIGRIELDQYAALCETGAPPVLNATASDEVARHLHWLRTTPDERRALAARTREWFVANHGSERWLADHQAVLAATSLSWRSASKGNPLWAEYSQEEKQYHALGLANAPEFPNYGF